MKKIFIILILGILASDYSWCQCICNPNTPSPSSCDPSYTVTSSLNPCNINNYICQGSDSICFSLNISPIVDSISICWSDALNALISPISCYNTASFYPNVIKQVYKYNIDTIINNGYILVNCTLSTYTQCPGPAFTPSGSNSYPYYIRFKPKVKFSVVDQNGSSTLCEGEPVFLNLDSTGANATQGFAEEASFTLNYNDGTPVIQGTVYNTGGITNPNNVFIPSIGGHVYSTPGQHTITLSITSQFCGSSTYTDTFNISSATQLSVTTNASIPYCSPDSIVVTGVNISPGGTFQNWIANGTPANGIAPLSTNLLLPTFQINSAGTYNMIATALGCCSSSLSICKDTITFTFAQGPIIAGKTDSIINCKDTIIDLSQQFLPNPITSDSVYIDSLSISGSIYSLFAGDYSTATNWHFYDGIYYITGVAINSCGPKRDTIVVSIIDVQSLSLGPDDSICYSSPVINFSSLFPLLPTPGIWTINGVQVTQLNPYLYPNQTIEAIYVYDPGIVNCRATDTIQYTIIGDSVTMLLPTLPLCDNAGQVTINGLPSGGIFSGATGLVSPNSTSGLYDPSLLSSGTTTDPVTYTVTFPALSGCTVSKTENITIFGFSNQALNIPDTICSGDQAVFSNPFYPGAVVDWDLGDGTIYTSNNSQTINHTYTTLNDTTFFVTAQFYQTGVASPCSTSVFLDSVHVLANPVPNNFTPSSNTICIYDSIVFTPLSSLINSVTYIWDFGPAGTFTGYNPPPQYYPLPVLDSVDWIISITSSNKCDTIVQTFTIKVYGTPTAVVTVSPPKPCSGDTISIYTYYTGGPNLFTWQFNNSVVSQDSILNDTVLVAIATDSLYIVTLTIANRCPLVNYTSIDSVLVQPSNAIPGFTVLDTNACVNETIIFTGYAPVYDYILWKFDDGSQDTGLVVTHSYTLPGTYQVWQIVYGPCGSDSISMNINVISNPNLIYAITQDTICVGDIICLSNNTTGSLPVSNLFYTWDFGDGNSSNQFQPCHLYAQPGTYNLQFTALEIPLGCASSATTQIYVKPVPIISVSTFDTLICEGGSVTLQCNPGSNAIQWTISPLLSTNLNPAYITIPDTGEYSVELLYISLNGCTNDTILEKINVKPYAIADFITTMIYPCNEFDTLMLTNNSSNNDYAQWLLNGQPLSLTTNASIDTLTINNTLQITLIANNVAGCADTITKPYTYYGVPKINLTTSPTNVCEKDSMFFNVDLINSASSILTVLPGIFTASQQFAYLFPSSGTYPISVFTTNNGGCSDSLFDTIIVRDQAVANINYSQSPLCGYPKTIILDSQGSQNTNGTFLWNYGLNLNGQSPLNQVVLTIPASILDNSVSLIAYSPYGCHDTVSTIVELPEQPIAVVTPLLDTICQGDVVYFESNSQLANSLLWIFPDNSISNANSVDFTFNNSGLFQVTLIAKGDSTCRDTATSKILVLERGNVEIKFKERDSIFIVGGAKQTICGLVDFNGLSNDSIIGWKWIFEEGDTLIGQNVSRYFKKNGNYSVRLLATNLSGCIEESAVEVFVNCPECELFIPNALILNFNGENAYFIPKGRNLNKFELHIYDSNGKLVWKTTAISNGEPAEKWDGKVDGKPVSQGGYYWQVKEAQFLNGCEWPGMQYPGRNPEKKGTLNVIW